jgi:hypothetical protein
MTSSSDWSRQDWTRASRRRTATYLRWNLSIATSRLRRRAVRNSEASNPMSFQLTVAALPRRWASRLPVESYPLLFNYHRLGTAPRLPLR